MPDDVSAVLALPLIQPAQAQKHVTHNEALRRLDVIVQLAVADRTRATPPDDPAIGDRHIVPAGASGDWAGQAGAIALRDVEGWVFETPRPGWRAHVLAEGLTAVFTGDAWVTPDALPQEVARLGIATAPDAQNRLAVAAPASLFTHAGDDHRLTVNKAAAAATASVVFQTGWSGRAEIGTTGGDDLAFRVSGDGAVFRDALVADRATGRVRLPGGLALADGDAAAPAAGFAADPDTGAFRPAADAIGVATGGAERLRIDAAGAILVATGEIRAGVSFADPAAPTAGSVVFHRGNILGTVGAAGAVVTGAALERGAGAAGAHRRDAAGWQTCLRADLGVANVGTAYGARFRSAAIVWTFPMAFAAGEVPVVSVNAAHPDVTGLRILAVSATAATFELVADVAIPAAVSLRAMAVGRWSTLA